MSAKNLEFLQILARPVMYQYPSFQKPSYSTMSQPYCDRCGQNLATYYSSKATPNTDLCPRCFDALKNDDSNIIISGPTGIIQHQTIAPAGCPPFGTTSLGMRSQQFSSNDSMSSSEK